MVLSKKTFLDNFMEGLDNVENPLKLVVIASQCLAAYTGDDTIYKHCRACVWDKYGYRFIGNYWLEQEVELTQGRIEKLCTAMEGAKSYEEVCPIVDAIGANEARKKHVLEVLGIEQQA
jgi:hypothetical protein